MKTLLLSIIAMILIFVLAVQVIVINVIRKVIVWESLKHYFKMLSWTYYLWRNSNGKNRWAKWFMIFINTIFMDKDHCKDSFYAEAERLKFRTEWM